jgi:hypothetical protein
MARELRSKEQRRQTLNAKVKNCPFPTYQIYRPRGVLSGARAPRALTAGEMLAHWQAGPTTTAVAAEPHARHHHSAVTGGPRQAVTSACPLCPLRVRPRCLKRRARGASLQPRLRALNGPVPYQVRETLERPELLAQISATLEGCERRPVASKPV